MAPILGQSLDEISVPNLVGGTSYIHPMLLIHVASLLMINFQSYIVRLILEVYNMYIYLFAFIDY